VKVEGERVVVCAWWEREYLCVVVFVLIFKVSTVRPSVQYLLFVRALFASTMFV